MRRNPAESEACLQEALRLLRGDRPVPVFELVAVLLTFADLKSSQGDLEGAQRMIEEALAVGDASIGKFSQPAANAHSSLGDLLRARGNQAEAESHYRIALEILTKIKGSDHPDLVRPLRSLARLHRERREFPAALEHYRRAETIVAAVYSQSMTLAGPDAKAAALANIGDSVPELLDFQREAAAQVPGSRELALEAVAARKSRVLSFLRDWRQDLRRHLGSRADERFEHWQELVDCRAALSVALEYREVRTPAVGGCTFKSEAFGAGYAAVVHALRNAPTPAAAERALAALGQVRSRLAGLEESLARSYPPLGNLLRGTSAQDIRKALQRGDALLELVRTADGRYGAFLLTTGGEPEWFDLGPAKPVDAAVRKLLRNANDWATSMALGERAGVRASATNFDNASASLSGFFQPVLSRLARSKAVRRLRIAPDGMLALVPFEGMKTGGSYVLERYEVSYVNSGIELAEMRQPLKPPGRPVIAVSPGPGGTKVTPRKAAFRAELLERLPGAREEARKLRMYFSDAEVVAEGRASEAYLKRVAGPGVFHIIGHGLFRSDADCAAEAGNCRAHADPAQRATELSAIVLDEVYGRGGSSTEDGFLTALELQSVDLSGTLMLVLSQCRMADGVPQSGEGVHGMRRAAMVAGAQTLVAPLWKVADRAQSLAMTAFYDALRQGRGRGAALRSAKLSLLRGKQYRHPLFWSSTILAGDDGPLPANLLRRHVH
jgi:CHAT domain-containing protein